MSESAEKQNKFLGTYFDRDSVIKLARWSDGLSWAILTIYLLLWVFSLLLFVSQYASGMMGDKGLNLLMGFSIFTPYLTQPIPGVAYFIGFQTVSKMLLVLLDVEDNSRRTARN